MIEQLQRIQNNTAIYDWGLESQGLQVGGVMVRPGHPYGFGSHRGRVKMKRQNLAAKLLVYSIKITHKALIAVRVVSKLQGGG